MQPKAARGGAVDLEHQSYAASCRHGVRAFNSTASRFGVEHVNSNPGPGNYFAPPSLDLKSDSIGRKGFGPLASSSKRLVSRVVYSGPGPGEYRPPMHFEQREDFNHAGATAVFRTPTASSRKDIGDADSTPGPGTNGTATTRTGERLDWTSASARGYGASSAFKCTERQAPGRCVSAEGPSPATYDVMKPWLNRTVSDIGIGQRSRHGSQPGDASRPSQGGGVGARSNNGRGSGLPLHSTQLSKAMGARLLRSAPRIRTIPAATAPAAAAAGLPDVPSEKGNRSQEPGRMAAPGPGAYEMQNDVHSIKMHLQHDAGRASCMFRPPAQIKHGGLLSRRLDANGAPMAHTTSAAVAAGSQRLQDAVPGPGSYYDMQKCSTVGKPGSVAVTSAFKSSPGHAGPQPSGAHIGRAPGPAFYAAQLPPDKRSYRHPVAAVERVFV